MQQPPVLPVAYKWFHTTVIDEAITLITEPHVEQYVSANTWFIKGESNDLLIDSGLGVASLRLAFADSLFAERLPVVVLTHAHLDHMGSAHEFLECWAHPAEPTTDLGRGSLSGPELARILGFVADPRDPIPSVLVTAVPHESYDPLRDYQLEPVSPSRHLVDGDLVDLGDRCLEVLHLPGHTPGSIALYDSANRTLFTGDVIYDEALDDSLAESNPDAYRQSLRRLLRLDVETVHAGHEGSFDGERLEWLAERYLRSGKAGAWGGLK